MSPRFALMLVALLAAGPAMAQSSMPDMPGMEGMPGMSPGAGTDVDDLPSVKAYKESDEHMHKAMTRTYTGDADKDFVAGMIGHHQGAIDMAKVVLKYGKDPEIAKLAKGVIEAQTSEIAQMRAWQAKHP